MSVIGEVICLTCLTHEHIDTMLKKYDMDDDRELNFGELKALMVDLNDGKEVLDVEVKAIMKNADASKNFHISRTELKRFRSIWASYAENNPNREHLPRVEIIFGCSDSRITTATCVDSERIDLSD
eukprot:1182631-Prorocentrum_minimum.AAC.1